MHRATPLALLVLAGCSSTPEGVGLMGNPKSRDAEPVQKTDIKSVSLRKGAMVAEHDAIEDNHCGGGCNFRKKSLAQLELTIEPQGVARAKDKGEQLEEFRSTAGGTKHKLTWDRSWSGSWSEGRGEVVITLKPDTTSCQQNGEDGSAMPNPCNEVPLVLLCEAGSIPLDKPKNKLARAWICRPRGKVVAGEGITPFPWVFGVDYQVDTSDRSTGERIVRFFLGDPPKEPKNRESI